MEPERHDLDDPGRPDRAAGPEQRQTGFGEGQEDAVRTPQEEQIGEFSEGLEQKPGDPAEERIGRFSDTMEGEPETVEKNLEGSFATGQETHPEDRYEQAEETTALREAAAEETATGAHGVRDRGTRDAGAVRADEAGGDRPLR